MTNTNNLDNTNNISPMAQGIAEDLHLVDFSQTTPQALKQQVTDALKKANTFLDNLSDSQLSKQSDRQSNNQSDDPVNKQHDNKELDAKAKTALADIIEFDHIGLDLDRSWGIVSHLNSVMSNDDIRATHHELLPALSEFGTKVGQHQPLYQRYLTVKNNNEFFSRLPSARQRAIELAIQSFELSGIGLDAEKQSAYADIQSELSTLSAKFSDNILDATQAFALSLNEEQLAGITESGLAMLAAAGEQYKQKIATEVTKIEGNSDLSSDASADNTLPTPYYVATLDIPVYLAVMTHADDRDLREQLYKAYVTRASDLDAHTNAKGDSLDNSDIMADILRLRDKKAKLLGFNNYAEVSLSRKMADTVTEVEQFLRELADKAKPSAEKDLQELQAQALNYGIKADDLQPWDTAYLAEKVKQEKFSLSQEDIRPYFPLPTVINGLFNIVNKLYGIKVVEETKNVTLWHDDVRFYQLFDKHEQLIGGFYFDLYARQGKRGGAWMSGFQSRYLYNDATDRIQYNQLPVCFMVGNFTPPNGDTPSLLTHNEVITLFHEFGHGLHHLLTTVSVGDVAGVNGVEWDAVELPSQFMENWAWHSEGIELISAHVDTGEPLPKDKLDALLSAKNFQSGMQTLRQIEFALFDLLIHATSPAPDYYGILATLDTVRHDVALLETPEYNRFANGFSHIFAGGYAAGYYSYKWAELLSADAFSRFEEDGIFNPQTGKAFREAILSVGGSAPAKVNFEKFRGRSATIDALLRHSGFVVTSETKA